MAKLFVELDRYQSPPANPLVEATHALVRNLVRRRLEERGCDYNAFVFEASDDAITSADFQEIEKQILASGHRFAWTAMISRQERPEIYLADDSDAAAISIEHTEAVVSAPDSEGREQRGVGDNVTRTRSNTIGVARYVINPDGKSCEFAIVVSDKIQHQGIGTRLMKALFGAARDHGLTIMEGSVLKNNTAMLGLMKDLGFSQRKDPDDPDLVKVEHWL